MDNRMPFAALTFVRFDATVSLLVLPQLSLGFELFCAAFAIFVHFGALKGTLARVRTNVHCHGLFAVARVRTHRIRTAVLFIVRSSLSHRRWRVGFGSNILDIVNFFNFFNLLWQRQRQCVQCRDVFARTHTASFLTHRLLLFLRFLFLFVLFPVTFERIEHHRVVRTVHLHLRDLHILHSLFALLFLFALPFILFVLMRFVQFARVLRAFVLRAFCLRV